MQHAGNIIIEKNCHTGYQRSLADGVIPVLAVSSFDNRSDFIIN